MSQKDDLISRQAAIDALEKIPVREFKKFDDGLLDALISIGQVYRALKQLPSAQRWIPCSERMPEDYVDVLAWFEYYRYGRYECLYQTYGIGTYSKQFNSWMINHETGWRDLRVIAWMPLPKAYREDGKE